jgi:hypothetical protein
VASAVPAAGDAVIHNENEFHFQYHENKLATGCRAPPRLRSPFMVITITLACTIYQYALHRLKERYSCGPSWNASVSHGETTSTSVPGSSPLHPHGARPTLNN